MRAAVRQTRPMERLVRRSKAKAPAGFNRQRQWRLKTIRLVQPEKLNIYKFEFSRVKIATMESKAGSPRQVVGKRRERQHAQERGNVRRKLLLDAAIQLLETTPIEELSFKQVSDKGGCSRRLSLSLFCQSLRLTGGLGESTRPRFCRCLFTTHCTRGHS